MDEETKNFIIEQMNLLYERLDARFKQVDDRFDQMDVRFKQVDDRFDKIDVRFDVLAKVVRESVEDILDNQVEEIARHTLHEEKIKTLEATTFRLDKTTMQLKNRLDRLEDR